MGPDQHAQLDDFGLAFPFPYRVAALLLAGFWGWGVNLKYLLSYNVDLASLIRYPPRQASHQEPHHTSAFRLATVLSVPLGLSFLFFSITTRGTVEQVERLDIIPQSYFVIALFLLILPVNPVSRSGRRRFLLTLKRISIGGLAETQDGKFGDVLLADALTSYAKVLADLYVTFCMFFTGGISSTSQPDRMCGKDYIVPTIIAIPSVIRLRQCLTEYLRARRAGLSRENSKANQHLANALKYSSAFPVIILAAKVRNYNPMEFYEISEIGVSRILHFFALINSSYSFYWDITKDWDLTLFTSARADPDHPFGLRRHRYFSDRQYYSAIVIDFFIRFSWLSKFVSGLTWLSEKESGIFILLSLEVARRWMWVFLRSEAELIRNSRGPVPDDIRLGEINGKLDAD